MGSTENPYQYRGQWTDAFTSYQYLRSRHYNPAVGRFLSRDPAGFELANPVDFNRYRYSASNPVNASDPLGQQTIFEFITTNLGIQNEAGVAEYAEQRAGESALAATMDAGIDMLAGEIFAITISELWNDALPGIAGDIYGRRGANGITISSARAIPALWDKRIFPDMLAAKEWEGIPRAYKDLDRKNFVGVSGLVINPSWNTKAAYVMSQIWDELGKLFPDETVEDAFDPGADRCESHAEKKVVGKAGKDWTILGIGASRDVCMSCQRVIRKHSPAALIAPIGFEARCKK